MRYHVGMPINRTVITLFACFLWLAAGSCTGGSPVAELPSSEEGQSASVRGEEPAVEETGLLSESAPAPAEAVGSETSHRRESAVGGSPDWESLRREMVQEQIVARGVTDERIVAAMLSVPRHEFVPQRYRTRAYGDHPLPIAEGQTISQPLIVALMSRLADIQEGDVVLEIGTGSGYHAAVLSELGATIYTIEIVESLARSARLVLAAMGYDSVQVRFGDGYQGWPEHAPFDAIIVTAAPPAVPRPLMEQLKVGGRMVLPVGEREQELEVILRTEDGFERTRHGAVRFVPMTGEASLRGRGGGGLRVGSAAQ